MTKPSVLLSALDNYGGHPFDNIFDIIVPTYGAEDVKTAFELQPERIALVIWGGADISPAIYNQVANKYTDGGNIPSKRDALEIEMAETCMKLGIPIIGICRGAQLMCALSGGSLVQDVTGHAGGYHKIVTNDEREFSCPSLHHQMMYPWAKLPIKFDLIAWTPEPRSKHYYGQPVPEDEQSMDQWACEELKLEGPEPEIIWFPDTKSLCIQSHPEFIHDSNHPFVQYTLELTRKYILPEAKDGE